MVNTARGKVPRTSQFATVPASQRRQQALDACLEACADLGVLPEDAAPTSVPSAAEDACRLVEVSERLAATQTALAVKEDLRAYGNLLDLSRLREKARNLEDGQAALAAVVANQEKLVKFLQQPHSGACLAVESGYQQHVLHVLQLASQDAKVLTQGVEDLEWVMQFKEPSTIWSKLLQPSPQLTSVIQQCHEGLVTLHAATQKFAGEEVATL